MKLGKLERPPYAHNWVRYLFPDEDRTCKALVEFVTSKIQYTYTAASPIIRDRIMYSLDKETAMKAALNKGRMNSRKIVSEYVSAFYDYDLTRGFAGKPYFDEIIEPFRIAKGISVPVKPLITVVENGRPLPVFSVGWASFPLDRWQMRLLATVFEDAVFSLADFRSADGEFLCFPKSGKGSSDRREPLVWNRGDFELFSKNELRDVLDMYVSALERAKAIVGDIALDVSSDVAEPPVADIPLLDWGLGPR